MINWKRILVLGLILLLIIFGLIVSIKCSTLENRLLNLELQKETVIDSLKYENANLNKEIIILCDSLYYYENKIDSLKEVKQKVIVKYKYIESKNLTESVKELKNNLLWEKR